MIVCAAMVPHPPIAVSEVGNGEEEKMRITLDGYKAVSEFIASFRPDTIVLSSPHAILYRDYFQVSSGNHGYGDLGQFQARQVSFDIPYDEEFTASLNADLTADGFPGGTDYDREQLLDHGTMVPLYFLRQALPSFKLVRIGLSGLPLRKHYELGMHIAETAEKLNRRVAYIASGDLAHNQKEDGPYGYSKEGPEYDARIMKDMGNADFLQLFHYDPVFLEKAMECGHRSFVMMAGALDRRNVEAEAVSHEAPFGVGYGIIKFTVKGRNDDRSILDQYLKEEEKAIQNRMLSEDPYVYLARRTIEIWVKEHKRIQSAEDLPAEMTEDKAGVFVSIHENGELRGCIGTIRPVYESIAQEIMHNAVSASTKDPRFEPIQKEELPYLDINVDVLKKPEIIRDRSELDVKRYGVICSKSGRQGLLLPNLDGVDTVEQQIDIACRKGGIDPDEDDIVMQRFEVVRHV